MGNKRYINLFSYLEQDATILNRLCGRKKLIKTYKKIEILLIFGQRSVKD